MCQVKSCCCWSLRTGAIITSVLTAAWCIYILAIGIIFFTTSVETVKELSTEYKKDRDLFDDKYQTNRYDETHKKALGMIGYQVLSWIYFAFEFLGIIALISLIVGFAQQKSCPIIFWMIFITIGLILHVLLCIVHFATDEKLSIAIKLMGPIFLIVFLYPWIVTFSYYKSIQLNSRGGTNYAGIVLSPPRT